MSDTPETDAAADFVLIGGSRVVEFVDIDFARRLERERNDLLARLTAIEHAMPEELAKLERERDQAWERVHESSMLGVNALIRVEDLRQELAAERALAHRLVKIATAVIDQFETPNWKLTESTATYMNTLRNIITAWKEARNEEHG